MKPAKCIICSSQNSKALCQLPNLEPPCSPTICRDCGFVFLDPIWPKSRYDEYYRREYDLEFRSELSNKEIYSNKIRNGKEVLARLQPYSTMPKSFLDIGAGPGAQLKVFTEAFPQAEKIEAIEMSEACRKRMADDGISLLSGDLYDSWHLRREGAYDVITMRHVLEHCIDPDAVLAKVNRVLAPKGRFYLAVPDMEKPHGNLIDYWFRVAHIWYFDRDTLATVAERNGFSVLQVGGDNAEIFLILEKATEARRKAGEAMKRPELARNRESELARKVRAERIRMLARNLKRSAKRLIPGLSR